MSLRLVSAALLAVAAAAPVGAVTYDAFGSFTGTATGGQFTYGTFDGSGFTAFSDTAGCASLISDVVCTSNGFLPAAFKSTGGAHQSGSVTVPGEALVLHPGPNAGEASAVLFTAPVTANYMVNFSSFVADTNPSGVNIIVFVPGSVHYTLATLSAAHPTYSVGATLYPNGDVVAAGFSFGFAVDYAGSYYNDSTGINLSVTPFNVVTPITTASAPEPASWALLVVGFGFVGVAARRRGRVVA